MKMEVKTTNLISALDREIIDALKISINHPVHAESFMAECKQAISGIKTLLIYAGHYSDTDSPFWDLVQDRWHLAHDAWVIAVQIDDDAERAEALQNFAAKYRYTLD